MKMICSVRAIFLNIQVAGYVQYLLCVLTHYDTIRMLSSLMTSQMSDMSESAIDLVCPSPMHSHVLLCFELIEENTVNKL